MAGRSPARFLAPLTLVVFAIALYVVVSNTTRGNDEQATNGSRSTQTAEPTATPERKKRKGRKSYTVQSGDTPSGIAERFDIPLAELLALNPDVDPQALAPGTKLKLRK